MLRDLRNHSKCNLLQFEFVQDPPLYVKHTFQDPQGMLGNAGNTALSTRYTFSHTYLPVIKLNFKINHKKR